MSFFMCAGADLFRVAGLSARIQRGAGVTMENLLIMAAAHIIMVVENSRSSDFEFSVNSIDKRE